MRQLTAADITDFHASRYDLLVLTTDGEYAHLDESSIDTSSYDDHRATAYDYCRTHDGDEVQILLARTTIEEGDWIPDALDDDGNLLPAAAAEMANMITVDGILPSRVRKAQAAGQRWTAQAAAADAAALDRAHAVADVVAITGGNQSYAARALGLNQSTVNRLLKKIS